MCRPMCRSNTNLLPSVPLSTLSPTPQTFTRDIQHKGWIGGWLMPQVGLVAACPDAASDNRSPPAPAWVTVPLPAHVHPAQEKSYFALKLPGGWWMFGFDLGLVTVSPWHQGYSQSHVHLVSDVLELPEAVPSQQAQAPGKFVPLLYSV